MSLCSVLRKLSCLDSVGGKLVNDGTEKLQVPATTKNDGLGTIPLWRVAQCLSKGNLLGVIAPHLIVKRDKID